MNAQSPVQLQHYRIKSFHFDIIKEFDQFDALKATYNINVDYDIACVTEDEQTFRIKVIINIYPPKDEEMFLPYKLDTVYEGIFHFEDKIDEDEKKFHLNISCPSMLYGIIRGNVKQITGDANYGPILLPTIQFASIAEEKSIEARPSTTADSEAKNDIDQS